MFQGSCCHPISPAKGAKKQAQDGQYQLSIDENDQIFKITNKIDIDDDLDLSHFTDEQ